MVIEMDNLDLDQLLVNEEWQIILTFDITDEALPVLSASILGVECQDAMTRAIVKNIDEGEGDTYLFNLITEKLRRHRAESEEEYAITQHELKQDDSLFALAWSMVMLYAEMNGRR